MKKLLIYFYRVVLFLALFLMGICLLNKIEQETWTMFFIDLGMRFIDNKKYLHNFSLFMSLFIFFIVWVYLGLAGKVQLKWKIRIGKFIYYYNNCKCFEKIYYPFLIIVIVCIGMVLLYINHELERIYKGNLWEGTVAIGHSFGAIDGHTYTGSLEAFEYNYQKGIRTFEVDLDITSDDKVVLRHDWGQKIQEGISEESIPTEEEFLSIPILEKYTPLSFYDLCFLMQKYPDIWIVTDSKYNDPETVNKQFKIMKETAEKAGDIQVLDRLVIQLYNEKMYEIVREVYPFKSYIFTMYMRWFGNVEDFIDVCRWSAEQNINVITMGYDLPTEEIMGIAKRYGIDVYLNTINNKEKALSFIQMGVKGIYTDKLSLKDLEE